MVLNEANPIYSEIITFIEKNNLQNAKRIYKEILKTNPNHFQSICFLGTLSIQIKNFERAK